MILSLRQRHRQVFAVLGILLPVAMVGGIAARKSILTVAELPPVIAKPLAGTGVAWERRDVFEKLPVVVSLATNAQADVSLRLEATADFARPDVMVYWSAAKIAPTDTLSADAILLGAFAANELRVPTSAMAARGHLILFSLADQEIVAVSRAIQLNYGAN